MLEIQFKKCNFEVVSAKNGYEALEKVQKSLADGNPFDLVLLDLQMPISNGFETAKNILNLYDKNKIFKLGPHSCTVKNRRADSNKSLSLSSSINSDSIYNPDPDEPNNLETPPILMASSGFVDKFVYQQAI